MKITLTGSLGNISRVSVLLKLNMYVVIVPHCLATMKPNFVAGEL
jgi:hypothetical protein